MELVFTNELHYKIWQEVERRVTGIGKKDYVLHLKMVTKAMQDIIADEGGNLDLMLPAAMLHDSGLSKIPKELWYPKTPEEKDNYEELHIRLAAEVIPEVLKPLGYSESEIAEILRIAQAHKSKDSKGDNAVACMVDADNLSDTYKESFYSDVKSYGNNLMSTYEFRCKNKFFTKTANKVFQEQLKARLSEIESGEAERILNQQ